MGQDYLVVWEINIQAETPEEAARVAREYQLDPTAQVQTFDVIDESGNVTRINLDEYEGADHE